MKRPMWLFAAFFTGSFVTTIVTVRLALKTPWTRKIIVDVMTDEIRRNLYGGYKTPDGRPLDPRMSTD